MMIHYKIRPGRAIHAAMVILFWLVFLNFLNKLLSAYCGKGKG